jgi:hypothetical protein
MKASAIMQPKEIWNLCGPYKHHSTVLLAYIEYQNKLQ